MVEADRPRELRADLLGLAPDDLGLDLADAVHLERDIAADLEIGLAFGPEAVARNVEQPDLDRAPFVGAKARALADAIARMATPILVAGCAGQHLPGPFPRQG